MTEFLSVGWIEALDAQLAKAARGSSPRELTVQYLVTDGDRTIAYNLRLGPDRDRAMAGLADDAEVTFSMELETARSISNGKLSTEEAFIAGDVGIEGDPTLLIDAYRASPDA